MQIVIQPLGPRERDGVLEVFSALSARSRFLRFGVLKPDLSVSELRFLADVDGADHVGAIARLPRSGEAVAVGRYVRAPRGGDRAEIAIEVADEWQRQGIGGQMLRYLMREARRSGVRTLEAAILAENVGAHRLLRGAGFRCVEMAGRDRTFALDLGRQPALAGYSIGSGPSGASGERGPWMRRSRSSMRRSLMLASRRTMSPWMSNSQSSLP
jgi:acetyltransferase